MKVWILVSMHEDDECDGTPVSILDVFASESGANAARDEERERGACRLDFGHQWAEDYADNDEDAEPWCLRCGHRYEVEGYDVRGVGSMRAVSADDARRCVACDGDLGALCHTRDDECNA